MNSVCEMYRQAAFLSFLSTSWAHCGILLFASEQVPFKLASVLHCRIHQKPTFACLNGEASFCNAAWHMRHGPSGILFFLIVGISYFPVWDPLLRCPINMEGMGLPLKQLTLADVRTCFLNSKPRLSRGQNFHWYTTACVAGSVMPRLKRLQSHATHTSCLECNVGSHNS